MARPSGRAGRRARGQVGHGATERAPGYSAARTGAIEHKASGHREHAARQLRLHRSKKGTARFVQTKYSTAQRSDPRSGYTSTDTCSGMHAQRWASATVPSVVRTVRHTTAHAAARQHCGPGVTSKASLGIASRADAMKGDGEGVNKPGHDGRCDNLHKAAHEARTGATLGKDLTLHEQAPWLEDSDDDEPAPTGDIEVSDWDVPGLMPELGHRDDSDDVAGPPSLTEPSLSVPFLSAPPLSASDDEARGHAFMAITDEPAQTGVHA